MSTRASTPRVAIWTGEDPIRWSPTEIERSGLGGTETAVVRVAEELALGGYEVGVFGNVETGSHRGVRYGSAGEFVADDAAVLWLRMPPRSEDLGRPARSLAWVHQRDLGAGFSSRDAELLDGVLAVSAWHRDLILTAHPGLTDRVTIVGNGVELGLFTPPEDGADRCPRVLFTSQPERGLDVLLELWPAVRERVPEAELAWCYAPVYDRIADRGWVADHRQRVADLADQPGATPLGPLPKPELAELMRNSSVWAHPSWATPFSAFFDETSCIAAMEAQATGLCVVASAWGALPETIRVGELIDPEGAPGEPWRAALIEALVSALTNASLQARAAREGPAEMANRGWDAVAASIVDVIEGER